MVPHALYHQYREDLNQYSMREIDKYQSIFGLTDKEINLLKEHMSLWESLRMCCGMQMSKYEILRLNGCDVTKYMNETDYPNCEYKNLTDIELRFESSTLSNHEVT